MFYERESEVHIQSGNPALAWAVSQNINTSQTTKTKLKRCYVLHKVFGTIIFDA